MLLRQLGPSVPAVCAALLLACGGSTSQTRVNTSAGTSSVAAGAPSEATPSADGLTQLHIVALSDFHGWLLPLEPRGFSKYYGGIANIASHLELRDKLTPQNSLLLDNGDMWTGPTEATFLRGESVIEAYNALGIAAVNIANHEFDFGQDVLRARVGEAKFPFLGANIVKAGTQEHPDFVKPYVIIERAGIKVGVIGLSYLDTPKTTLAKHVAGLEFLDYTPTLNRFVPEMRKDGAEIVVVLFHDVLEVATKVIQGLSVPVDAVIAGQNHRKGQALVGEVPVVNPGPFGRSYVRFDITFDPKARKVVTLQHELVDVTGDIGAPAYPPSPALLAVAEHAKEKAKSLSGEVLGRLAKPLPVGTFSDSPLGHFIVDTWLTALPDVDVAVCNHGALRQPLASGPVTLGDILGVMPFENNLYIVRITGKQLKTQLAIDGPVVSGITWSYRKGTNGTRTIVSIVDRLGKPLDDNKKYSVAINDFMYLGGDGFSFKDLDGQPEDTGLSWRQPVLRALRLAEQTNRRAEPQSTARARVVK